MSQRKRDNILKILLILIVAIVILSLTYIKKFNYEVYLNNKKVGIYNKSVIKEKYNEVVNNLENRFEEVNIESSNIKYKITSKDVDNVSEEQLKIELAKSIQGNVKAKEMLINDNFVAYIANEEEGHKVLQGLGELYNTDKSIGNIEISCRTDYKDKYVDISEIKSIDEIERYIFDLNQNKNNLGIEIKYNEVKEEIISPKKIVISDKNMYTGYSKVKSGTEGKKEVVKEITYLNGVKKGEKEIDSRVIEAAVEEIIYEGCKNPLQANIAFLYKPARGGITSGFGERWGKTHHGIDIAGSIGEPIKAAADGVVLEANYDSVYGNKVILNHGNNVSTVYGHCSKLLVKQGDNVKSGDIIANVGSTGRSTGPHVHFELRDSGRAINPIEYIK